MYYLSMCRRTKEITEPRNIIPPYPPGKSALRRCDVEVTGICEILKA
jgi:hypothetical protein